MAVPGVKTADLRVTADPQARTVSIVGRTETENRRAHYEQAVCLPKDADAESELTEARHFDGIVTVSVPKRAPPVKPNARRLVLNDLQTASDPASAGPDPMLAKAPDAPMEGEKKADGAEGSEADDSYLITVSAPGVRQEDITA